jgi:hypothetical protein
MNYYYDLPQDIITLIEDKVKEEELIKKSLNEWKNKMMSVNKILTWTWDVDEYKQSIEEGLTLLNDTTKTIMGQDYINCFRGGKTNIKNIKLKLISTEEERKNKNIEIANTLKVGDRFCYSIASVPQYLKYYYHYGDRINDLNREGIVRFTTKCKVYVDIYGYIDKSKVLYSF